MVSHHYARRAPAARIAGVTALALLLSSAAMPGMAALPGGAVHDFTDGEDHGWITYNNAGSVAHSTASGEFCADVSGAANPWDIAAQLGGVTFERDVTYRVSFDAHASAPVNVPLQGGPDWPATFGATVALDGTSTAQPFEFTFTPGDWPTVTENPASPVADDWTTTTGNIAFQLGGQAAPYTLCFDNFSMVNAASEQLEGGDFDNGAPPQWYASDGLAPTYDGGVMCAAIAPGTTNRWDQNFGFNGVVMEPGTTYTLSFEASSDIGRAIRVVIGDNDPPYDVFMEQSITLGEDLERYTYHYTASRPFDAQPGEEVGTGQVAFQVGGSPEAWTFCLDNVSLLAGTVPANYVPETGPRVRVNQVGYLPQGPKQATIVTDETDPITWELLNTADATVASGTTVPAGIDPTAGLNVHVVDFSDFTTSGTYTVVADGEESYSFVIDADIYQQLRYDALNYFYLARSGIDIDGSIAGDVRYSRDAGHVNDPDRSRVPGSANLGDYDTPCLSPATEGQYWMYGDWECNYTLDVVGGWYDAGDHGKYVVNGGISVAQVMGTYERTLYSPTGADANLGDGTLNIPLAESTNGVPDALDEARWQLEWMMSMQVPADGTMYAGMVHHKVHDADWTGLPLMPANDPQARYLHRPSTAATLNFAAVAAQGARLWAEYDQAFADELLAAGQVAWEAALETPDLFAPAPNADPSPGGGPYDDDSVGDEFYWAAAELYLTTGDQEYEDYVLASEYHSENIFEPTGFFWGDVAALGRMNLATVESEIPGRAQIRQSVVDAAEVVLAAQQRQPFGTAYPGDEDGQYDWGSNSAILNNQVVLGTAFDLTSDQRFADAVLGSMDYLLGRNALNQSYITDYGHVFSKNQHSRWFANQLEPSLPNPPSGSVSGGPNSMTDTWDPVIQGLYSPDYMCAPQLCYIDDIQSWATNEITVNWNSAMSWVASFVADQAAGDESGAGQIVNVVTAPQDVSVVEGTVAEFSVSVTGSPAAEFQWQQLVDGVWTDIDGATDAVLAIAAELGDDGTQYRVYASNEFGGVYTDAVTLTVTAVANGTDPTPPGGETPPGSETPPGGDTPPAGEGPSGTDDPVTPGDGPDGDLALTGPQVTLLVVAALALLAAGGIAVGVARSRRSAMGI
ncbi:MAG: glycoside hydrolase family 9 protein [Demequina sp.]